MYELQSILIGGICGAALLALFHLTLWEWRPRFHIVARYTIGVACLNIGVTITAALLADWLIAITAWGIAGMGGAVVGGLHLWRWQGDSRATINLVRRAIGQRGVGDGAWEAREPDDRRV